jgi:hypothetical protein
MPKHLINPSKGCSVSNKAQSERTPTGVNSTVYDNKEIAVAVQIIHRKVAVGGSKTAQRTRFNLVL